MYVYKNNINDTSNKIIIPWQIIINVTIFFSRMYACFPCYWNKFILRSYFFFSLDKNTDNRVCVIFIWKMCKIVKLGQL